MTLDPESLTTLAAVKAQLEIDPADTSQDELLADMIQAATAAVETFCKRRFAYSDAVTETFLAYGVRELFLRRPPVESVAVVSMDGATLRSDAYRVDEATGVVTILQPTSVSRASRYLVRYTGGFVTPAQEEASGGALERTLPRDVELAALLVVTTLYRNRGRDANVTSESVLSARQAWGDSGWLVLSPAAQALLNPWRLYP